MIIVLVETDAKGLTTVSREALTFARELGTRSSSAVEAVLVGTPTSETLGSLGEQGVVKVHVADDERLSSYAGAAWAAAVCDVVESSKADVLLAAGTPRGMEVLAHVAARLEVAMAANVARGDDGIRRRTAGPPPGRRRCGAGRDAARGPGARHRGRRPRVRSGLSGHAGDDRGADVRSPPVTERDLVARVVRVEASEADDTGALTSARVVVGAGRGAGGPDGFGDLLELTRLVGGALGVSRVVTSLGWRPHSEQVGQTGSRIAPEIYIACGISGAIQHWAGCQSAKTILAINTDAEAPMMTKAHYAVVGDLHEIVPAINAELHARLGR